MQREGRPWGAGNAMKEKEKEKQSLKVVIVGNGKVGFSLAEQLVREKHDVTIVDMREDPPPGLRRAGRHVRPGQRRLRRHTGGGGRRRRRPAHRRHQLRTRSTWSAASPPSAWAPSIPSPASATWSTPWSSPTLKQDLGIDMVINPENATAVEISRLLRFPSAANHRDLLPGPGGADRLPGPGGGLSGGPAPVRPVRPGQGPAHAVLRGRAGGGRSSSPTAPSCPRWGTSSI